MRNRVKYTIYDVISKTSKDKTVKKFKVRNIGFERLKDSILKFKLQTCSKVTYNKRKHYTIRELGFNTIYKLTTKGIKRWEKYFSDGGKVYIKSYSTREPFCDRILFEKKINKYIGNDVPLPKKIKPPKRSYVKGGVGGKVYGFDFYLRDDKLYPKQRNILLKQSENYIGFMEHEQTSTKGSENLDRVNVTYLDPSLTDIENVETWNNFFQQYGMRFPEFQDKWMKLFGNDLKETGESIQNEGEYEFIKKKIEEIRNVLSVHKKLDF